MPSIATNLAALFQNLQKESELTLMRQFALFLS